ncbi:MAG: F0F1 ATP synthase subunit B [bacterium]|nr:F0F1 ATP synthase subunit B [bacterium]
MSLNNIFSLDPGSVLYTIITFLILLLILRKFAWKPILGALEAREQGIRDDIERARFDRQAAEQARQSHEQALGEARREAQALLGESRERAQRYEAEQAELARAEAQKLRERASEEIAREAIKVRQSLQGELVGLSLAAAEQVMRRGLKRADHEAIIQDALRQAEQAS